LLTSIKKLEEIDWGEQARILISAADTVRNSEVEEILKRFLDREGLSLIVPHEGERYIPKMHIIRGEQDTNGKIARGKICRVITRGVQKGNDIIGKSLIVLSSG
jgi:hypothetical protein